MAHLIHTFTELESYCRAFAEGGLRFLVLLGSPGIGKSETLRRAIPDLPKPDAKGTYARWINNKLTPIQAYMELYGYRDAPFVLDDVEQLLIQRQFISLLKAVVDTKPRRKIAWQSSAKELIDAGIPREFTTSSRVAIVANEWSRDISTHLAAVEDRAILVKFVPTNQEIHQHASWFKDKEIFEYIGKSLDRIHRHTFRTYVKAKDLKDSGLPWRTYLETSFAPPDRLAILLEILKSNQYRSEGERYRRYFEQTGHSRAVYFKDKRELGELAQAYKIKPGRKSKKA